MRPNNPFTTITTLVGGGLNIVDAPDLLPDGKARELINFISTGHGRITPRRAATVVTSVPGEIVGIEMFPHGSYQSGGTRYSGAAILTWTGNKVDLYLVDANGANPTLIGTLAGWNAVGYKPRIAMAVINRKLFVVEEKKQFGMTVYDPFYDPTDSGNPVPTFYQPEFVFDPLFVKGKMYPRAITVYNNFLLVAGYGTQGEPSRPEVVRFSYLGLQNDADGAGDAGAIADINNDPPVPTPAETAKNLNLFDLEDYFMVGERGTPIVAWAPALGRLIICTPYSAWVLFGYDRSSFQLELLDNTKGCLGTNAMVSANGLVYWWSPVGPVRWTGSAVQEIGQEIYADIDKLDAEKVVATHVKSASEVRFYQGNKGFAFNYKTEQWSRITLPSDVDVWCAGWVSPFTSTNEGAAAPRTPPTTPPSLLTHDGVTKTAAVSSWVNGDVTPAVATIIERRKDSDLTWPNHPVGVLGNGENRFSHMGLEPSTKYQVRVKHSKNGVDTAYVTGSFTTDSVLTSKPARWFRVVSDPVRLQTPSQVGSTVGGFWAPSIYLTWEPPNLDAVTEIYRADGVLPEGEWGDLSKFFLIATTGKDAVFHRDGGSYGEIDSLDPNGSYTYTIRHVVGGVRSAAPSPAAIAVVATGTPPPAGGDGGPTDGSQSTPEDPFVDPERETSANDQSTNWGGHGNGGSGSTNGTAFTPRQPDESDIS